MEVEVPKIIGLFLKPQRRSPPPPLMAASTRILHLRRKALPTAAANRVSFRRFSASSSRDSPESTTDPSPAAEPSPKSLNAYLLNSIKSSLKEPQTPRNYSPAPPRNSLNFSIPKSQSSQSLQQIQQNLAGYRNRTVSPPSTAAATTPQPTSLEGIRQSLRSLKPSSPESLLNRNDVRRWTLPSAPNAHQSVIGGMKGNALPGNIFGRELNNGDDRNRTTPFFSKVYSHEDLGKELSLLRPEKKKGWFSLEELSERMAKLREKEKEEEDTGKPMSKTHSMIRNSLMMLQDTDMQKARDDARKRADFKLNPLSLSGRASFDLSSPPKEDLVEKYFHPDNMSAAEKMKIELQKVRDEFKTSESDCGSARVQVAQLTTKIKHLSDVLHPKDKHSKKGLRAMVEKRKKLLKYLRRTDWDSYCLVVSKLGLRDNPGYKI